MAANDDDARERDSEQRRGQSHEQPDGGGTRYEEQPGMGEDEHGDQPSQGEHATHHPPVGLDDPAVPEVPETTPDPGDSEAETSARIAREASGDQDAWGEPEDRPDHDGNEAYDQRDPGRGS